MGQAWGTVMDDIEHRIRERAYLLWTEEGRPDGRAEYHWHMARELIAVEESYTDTLLPVDTGMAPEPIEALVNAGEFPTTTDQGEMEIPQHPAGEDAAPAPAAPAEKASAKRAPRKAAAKSTEAPAQAAPKVPSGRSRSRTPVATAK